MVRIIKGAKGKSVVLADLFQKDHGDFLLCYEKRGPLWHELGNGFIYDADPEQIPLPDVLKELESMVVTHNPFVMFIYGLRTDEQVEIVCKWAESLPTLRLTVTQQTDGEIEVLEV